MKPSKLGNLPFIVMLYGIRVVFHRSESRVIRCRWFYSLPLWWFLLWVFPCLFPCGRSRTRGSRGVGARCSRRNRIYTRCPTVQLSSGSRSIASCRLAPSWRVRAIVPPSPPLDLSRGVWLVWRHCWAGSILFLPSFGICCFWIGEGGTCSKRSRGRRRLRRHKKCCTRRIWGFLSCWGGFLRCSLINLSQILLSQNYYAPVLVFFATLQ